MIRAKSHERRTDPDALPRWSQIKRGRIVTAQGCARVSSSRDSDTPVRPLSNADNFFFGKYLSMLPNQDRHKTPSGTVLKIINGKFSKINLDAAAAFSDIDQARAQVLYVEEAQQKKSALFALPSGCTRA